MAATILKYPLCLALNHASWRPIVMDGGISSGRSIGKLTNSFANPMAWSD